MENNKTDSTSELATLSKAICNYKPYMALFGLISFLTSAVLSIEGYNCLMDGTKHFHFSKQMSLFENMVCNENSFELMNICIGSVLLIIGILILVAFLWILQGCNNMKIEDKL